jgi:exopolysaccharide biosynthesis polyprenyl glycosylphosphotransferase
VLVTEYAERIQPVQRPAAPPRQGTAAAAGARRAPAGFGAAPAVGWYPRYATLLRVTDLFMISTALTLSYLLKFGGEASVWVNGTYLPYWLAATLIGVLWVSALGLRESRSRRVLGAGVEEYTRVLNASIGVFGVIAIAAYSTQAELSRIFFLTALPLGTAMLFTGRMAARHLLTRTRTEGGATTPCVVVGPPAEVMEAVHDLRLNPRVGYTPCAVALTGEAAIDDEVAMNLGAVEVFAFSNLQDRLKDLPTPSAVVVADGVSRQTIRQLAWSLENCSVELMLVSRLTDVAGPRTSISPIPGANLMHVDLPNYSRWDRAQKRVFDIVFSSAALLVLTPLMAAVAIAIKVSDGGPAFFRQTRVGQNGAPFVMHKFRTMTVGAEARVDELIAQTGGRALLFKVPDDPRVTPLGTLLRRYSLDELPQFWDVLRGRMTVVGPRPQMAREVAEYTTDAHRRLLLKPGITGLWQVNGRSTLSPEESIRLDLRYVENWSLADDMAIALRTVKVVLLGRDAC